MEPKAEEKEVKEEEAEKEIKEEEAEKEVKEEEAEKEVKEEEEESEKEVKEEEAEKEVKEEEAEKEVKEEAEKEVKEEVKEEESKETKKNDYSYCQMIIDAHKLMCIQVVTILIISILYINYYDDNIYDFVIYFCFGLLISVLLIASAVLIKKFNIISREKYYKKYSPYVLDFCKKYVDYSGENIAFFYAILSCSAHVLFAILALLYVKKYIKTSKKTNNALLISVILFLIYTYVNVYINDIFKQYTNPLEMTNTDYKIGFFSITLTYGGLLYYFETIKNEKDEFINKLIN
jgi:hypothetical protein